MKVVTFGELMLRLSPKDNLRLFQEKELETTFGGGEANVAVSIANYGMDASFVTKLPDNDISRAAIKELKSLSVDTNNIVFGGDRMGIYYAEKGVGVRPSKVIYDRAHSSISEADPSDFDFEKIFEGADWFHFTGITPALSKSCAEICEIAARKAKEMGLIVSCDLNYRSKLWSKEEAQKTMSKLMKYVDVLICNEQDASDVFGISSSRSDISNGVIAKEDYVLIASELQRKFSLNAVAITLRESLSASDNNWSAMLYKGDNSLFSKKYSLRIVDRIGGGDSFAGGLIYGMLSGFSDRDALEFAVSASALKHTIEGDYNRVTKDEVLRLMKGDKSGRVQR